GRGGRGAAARDWGGPRGVATAGVVAADVVIVGVVATDSPAVADCVLTAGGGASGGLGGAASAGGSDDSVGDVGAAVESRPGVASAGVSSFLRRISRGCRAVPNHPAFQARAEIRATRPTSSRTPLMTLRYFRRLFVPVATGASIAMSIGRSLVCSVGTVGPVDARLSPWNRPRTVFQMRSRRLGVLSPGVSSP